MNWKFDKSTCRMSMVDNFMPEYMGKWVNKEDGKMSVEFNFRGVDYNVDVPEGVVIGFRNDSPNELSTKRFVSFEDMYKFFRGLVLKQIDHEGYKIVRDYAKENCCVSLPRNSGRYPYKDAFDLLAESSKDFIDKHCRFHITNVIYNNPATIVFWSDGTKTVVKCEDGEIYDREKGLMAAYMKKHAEAVHDDKMGKILAKWLPKGLDLDNEPVNENMSTYVQSKLSRDHEKAVKKLNKQLKEKTGKDLKEHVFGDLSKEERDYMSSDEIIVADAWNTLDRDLKDKVCSEIEKAVLNGIDEQGLPYALPQANIDDDQTKQPALEKKDQLNQEFDKMMNPPVDNDDSERNKWSLRKDRPLNKTTVNRHKYLPVLESRAGFYRYEKSSYLTPSEASKWLRENNHDIVVAIDEYKAIYYRGEDMSWQLMSRIIKIIDTHDIHNAIFIRHKEMLYPPIESWELLNGKSRGIHTPDKLINFEYLWLMVVR